MLMGDIMTKDVPLLQINATLEQGVRMLRHSKLDGLPVVCEQGALVGIFTKANLMDALLAGASIADDIKPYYRRRVETVPVNTPYETVEKLVKTSPVGTGVVVDEENNVVGILTKVDMIMSLFRRTEKLANQLVTVYNSMHNGVIVIDKEFKVRLMNEPASQILGLDEAGTIGNPLSEIFPSLALEPVINDGQWLIGVKALWQDLEVMCNISPLIGEKGVNGAIIILQPLTELDELASELESTKRIYETLLTALNIAYEAIIVVDDGGKITLVNEAACRFFRKREGELLAKPIEEIMPNSRLPRTLKTGLSEINEVLVIDGHPCVVSRNPIVRKGQVIGAVGKITYQRLEEVRELSEKLAEMDQELSYYRAQAQGGRSLITFNQIITANKEMKQIKQEAAMIARGNSTVMLTGESGTGKELFAESIHNASPRRMKQFVQLNCGAIPENLAESELFGYAPGAFTGAHRDGKVGEFALANKGTLFLDEIGDLPLNLQGKLLRVLEDQSFTPVGGSKPIRVDVRIITATNKDLRYRVRVGEFRPDLFYRLNVINFKLIPLRMRPEDIIPLAYMFLEKYNREFGFNILDISREAKAILLAHSWPGNVRELRNVIERAVNYTRGKVLNVDNLPYYLRERESSSKGGEASYLSPATGNRKELDRDTILQILDRVNGNKSKAARALGISRTWLYEKLRQYDLI